MTDTVTPLPVPKKSELNQFVDDMFADAQELRAVLKDQGDRNDIKDRITCLKYLEEIAKTYVVLKKAATDDPAAAGATVRKYSAAFAKNAVGGGKKGRGRKAAEPDSDGESSDDDDDAA
jgi:hypothetical protein